MIMAGLVFHQAIKGEYKYFTGVMMRECPPKRHTELTVNDEYPSEGQSIQDNSKLNPHELINQKISVKDLVIA